MCLVINVDQMLVHSFAIENLDFRMLVLCVDSLSDYGVFRAMGNMMSGSFVISFGLFCRL